MIKWRRWKRFLLLRFPWRT